MYRDPTGVQWHRRNLPLLAHTETAFHGPDLDAVGATLDYFGPWLRILTTACPVPADPMQFITTVTNMVLLTYVHLRAHHAETYPTAEHTALLVVHLATRGFLPQVSQSRTDADGQRVIDQPHSS